MPPTHIYLSDIEAERLVRVWNGFKKAFSLQHIGPKRAGQIVERCYEFLTARKVSLGTK